jgi:hypothetical protein
VDNVDTVALAHYGPCAKRGVIEGSSHASQRLESISGYVIGKFSNKGRCDGKSEPAAEDSVVMGGGGHDIPPCRAL